MSFVASELPGASLPACLCQATQPSQAKQPGSWGWGWGGVRRGRVCAWGCIVAAAGTALKWVTSARRPSEATCRTLVCFTSLPALPPHPAPPCPVPPLDPPPPCPLPTCLLPAACRGWHFVEQYQGKDFPMPVKPELIDAIKDVSERVDGEVGGWGMGTGLRGDGFRVSITNSIRNVFGQPCPLSLLPCPPCSGRPTCMLWTRSLCGPR